MAKNLKAMLTEKLSENNRRHAAADQGAVFDAGRHHRKISLELIDVNPWQPRIYFNEVDLNALAASIDEVGLLQPISVREVNNRYEIIAGERRFRAHKKLGKHSIEAIVIQVDDAEMAIFGLVENIDREDLTDYEICKSLRQVERLFPSKKKLAESLGMNRQDMYKYFAFENLPDWCRVSLDVKPSLLSRAAAAELQVVVKARSSMPCFEQNFKTLWTQLENSEIDQSKLPGLLSKLCARTEKPEPMEPVRKLMKKSGVELGSITSKGGNVVFKLDLKTVSQDEIRSIEIFIDKLLGIAVTH